MDNQQIAKTLEQLADLMEFQGANAFRLRAYRNGARSIRELAEPLCSMLEDGEDVTKIDGIGKGVAQKCTELCTTGQLTQMQEILEKVPRTVLDLLNVPKLGPRKAAQLFHELGITNLQDLKTACESQQVRALSGFGAKTEQSILEGIQIAAAANRRMRWADADQLVERLRGHLSYCDAVQQLEFAGSYRRGKETVGDLDLLVTSGDAEAVMDHFGRYDEFDSVTARGPTKMSVRTAEGFQVDLRVVPEESFGAALQYFTGSREHNVVIRGMARRLGLRVNEWGIYRVDGDDTVRIGGRTEADIYESLGLPVFDPEIRENRCEFDWAEQGGVPPLVTRELIQGDLHMHTTATDGTATIEQMAQAARQRGLKYIAITDHSQRVSMANGLDEQRLLDQWREIDQLNDQAEDDFLILKGIECDILENGEMDLPDHVLAQADWVIGSVHYGQDQSREQITDRIVGALENEHVSMIAHPTGRILNKRPPYALDLDAVFEAAADNGKFLELNASPMRLDLNDLQLMIASSRGIGIVINTDAHRPAGLDNMRFGVQQARRGCLQPCHVANTWPWQKIEERLQNR